jgi:hypothetical protein
MPNNYRKPILYGALAVLFLYLIADAARLIDTSALLDGFGTSDSTPTKSELTSITIRQVDNRKLNLRIRYYLDSAHDSMGKLDVKVHDNPSRKVRLSGSLTELPAGNHSLVLTANRDPAWEKESFYTRDITVTLFDMNGKQFDQQIISHKALKWLVLRDDAAGDAPLSVAALQYQLADLFQAGNYNELDALCTQWHTKHIKTGIGEPALAAFESLPPARDIKRDWKQALSNIQAWKSTDGHSECATFAEARLWYRRAWIERGTANWDNLSELAIQIFRERLTKARQILDRNRHTLSDNPMWHTLYMDILTELGLGRKEVLDVFVEAIKLDNSYHPVYAAAAYTHFPQWGGSFVDLENFIRNALVTVDESDQNQLYVRIYSIIEDYFDPETELFRDTQVSWLRMKAGFEDLLQKYPDNSLFKNQYASYACRAGDAKTYLGIRQQLDRRRIVNKAWKHNYTVDTCDHTYMKRL